MSLRRYTVILEVSLPEIFYHWNYDPPVDGCGGSLGDVLPGGSMCGISFDKLLALGSGIHTLEFDETSRDQLRFEPKALNEDDRLFRQLRFELFAERTYANITGQPFTTILLAMTPLNVDRIVPLLNEVHLEKLNEYALEIAETKMERDKQGHSIFYSSGSSTQIPDENLKTIRSRFGPRVANKAL